MGNIRTIIKPFSSLGLPSRSVVLTFDDGPNPHGEVTARLLDVLKRHKVTACFCVPGVQATRYPALVRRIADEGHLIVNHSFTHPSVPLFLPAGLEVDIHRGDRAIGEALGVANYRSRFYRPPGGLVSETTAAAVDRLQMRILPVSFFPLDIFYTPATAPHLLRTTLQRIRQDGGGVIVVHDGLAGYPQPSWLTSQRWYNGNRTWVPEMVEAMIIALTNEGYVMGNERLVNSELKGKAVHYLSR